MKVYKMDSIYLYSQKILAALCIVALVAVVISMYFVFRHGVADPEIMHWLNSPIAELKTGHLLLIIFFAAILSKI